MDKLGVSEQGLTRVGWCRVRRHPPGEEIYTTVIRRSLAGLPAQRPSARQPA